MRLKRHLNFVGNIENNIVYFHKPGTLDSSVEIKLDDFNKYWEYFKIISKMKTVNKK